MQFIKRRLQGREELVSALVATVFFGAASGIISLLLNNYLAEVHSLSAESRGWIEFPRELPGFLMIFVVSALLILWRETQMAAIAMFFTAAGALGLGYLSPNAWLAALFITIWSLGDHVIFSVEGSIGLQLSHHGREGRRLGQFGAARNLGTIIGGLSIYLCALYIGARYALYFSIAAASALIAGALYWRLHTGRDQKRTSRIVLKRRYSLFYAISALFGVRKQIFLVFGSWVLVKLYGVDIKTMAFLFFFSSAIGVVFRPLLGEVIDWLGERTVLAVDEILLLSVCLSYAFAGDLLPKPYDLWLLYATYVLDAVLFALRVARTTYLKKIAETPSDITPTLTMGVTIDHSVSMLIPILSGWLWDHWGFRWVFVLAGVIALVGFFVCLKIPVFHKNPTTQPAKS